MPPPPPQPDGASEPREGFIAVGRVLRPHGAAGELRVAPFNPDSPNLQPGRDVYLNGERRCIERARPDRGRILLRLFGIRQRDAAEAARGALLEVAEDDLVREPGAWLVHEIVGLEVMTEEGRSLGRVSEVLATGANDVYVVAGPTGEALIPAIASVVREVDVPGGLIHITDTPGLLN